MFYKRMNDSFFYKKQSQHKLMSLYFILKSLLLQWLHKAHTYVGIGENYQHKAHKVYLRVSFLNQDNPCYYLYAGGAVNLQKRPPEEDHRA